MVLIVRDTEVTATEVQRVRRGPSSAPSVAVVVPCRNEGRWITLLLDAIATQERRPDEVIIVDDSTDDSAAMIEGWKRRHALLDVHVFSGNGLGIGAAMNLGISRASADIIVRLDGHSAPAPDYIRLALDTLDQPGAGLVGGVWQVEPSATTRFARVIAAVAVHAIGSGGAAYRHADVKSPQIEAVDTVPFGCFRRTLWQELGGYDERIGNEDYDFNYRVRQAGYDVLLNSGARCVYRPRATLFELARQYQGYGFAKCQMLRKSPLALRLRQVPPIIVLPWVLLTAAVAALTENSAAFVLAATYPVVVFAGALDIARRLRDPAAVPAASVVIGAVHFAWSAGFWRALLRR